MAEKRLTTYMDPPEAYKRTPCRVVVKLHQAVELPAGNDQVPRISEIEAIAGH
jgi:hypothetical protein